MKTIKHIIFIIAFAIAIQACKPSGGDYTGTEYMPDMAHPISYEANAYDAYDYHTWDEQSVFTRKQLTNKMHPVKGTVPRGYAGIHFTGKAVSDHPNAMAIPMNGKVPYYYQDTPEDRLRATAEITANPFPITTAGLERGKELYNIFCGICHGEKGDGLGYLVRDADPATGDAGGKYPAAPANLINDEFTAASNGRYYHAIMYGLNVMGAYKDKISYEERWQVIHYIRSLQAASKQLKYDETANTLNAQFGTPAAQLKQLSSANAVTDNAAAPATAQ
jgi:mono/diheme cytochrome c family protein